MIVLTALAYGFVALVLALGVWALGEFIIGAAEGMRGTRCRHCGRATWVDEAGWDRHAGSGERRCAGAETVASPILPRRLVRLTDSAALPEAAALLYNASLALAHAAETTDVECANRQLVRYAMEVHNQAMVIADYDQWSCVEIGQEGPVCMPAPELDRTDDDGSVWGSA